MTTIAKMSFLSGNRPVILNGYRFCPQGNFTVTVSGHMFGSREWGIQLASNWQRPTILLKHPSALQNRIIQTKMSVMPLLETIRQTKIAQNIKGTNYERRKLENWTSSKLQTNAHQETCYKNEKAGHRLGENIYNILNQRASSGISKELESEVDSPVLKISKILGQIPYKRGCAKTCSAVLAEKCK